MSKSLLTRPARSGGGNKINRTGPNKPNPSFRNEPQRQSGSGGGANYSRPPIRGGTPTTKKTSEDAVSNVGRMIGNHASDAAGGRSTVQRPATPLSVDVKAPVELGNTLAAKLGKGPGVGYVVHRSGSQGLHGNVRQAEGSPAQRRDILSEFGPESRGKR
jgi:hypothetical protein